MVLDRVFDAPASVEPQAVVPSRRRTGWDLVTKGHHMRATRPPDHPTAADPWATAASGRAPDAGSVPVSTVPSGDPASAERTGDADRLLVAVIALIGLAGTAAVALTIGAGTAAVVVLAFGVAVVAGVRTGR